MSQNALALIEGLPAAALAVIEGKTPLDFFAKPGGMDPLIGLIKTEALSLAPDTTTKKGRDAVVSHAFKVKKIKVAIEKLGEQLVEDDKVRIKAIMTECKRAVAEIQLIEEEARKPVTDFENREKNRVAEHERLLAELESVRTLKISTIEKLNLLASIEPRDWQEFTEKFTAARDNIAEDLQQQLSDEMKREDDRKELERLRKLQAERDAQDELDRIAAADAAKAQSVIEAEKRRMEQQIADDKTRAEKVEIDRIAAEKKAKDDATAAEERRVSDLAAAETKRLKDVEDAKEAERQRIEAQAKKEADEKAAREADLAYRVQIEHDAALKIESLICDAQGNAIEMARIIITAISEGHIPHITINY